MSKNKRKERRSIPVELGLTASGATRAETNQAIDANEHPHISQSGISKAAGHFAATVNYLRNPAHWWVIGLITLLALGTFGAGLKYLEDSAQQQRAASINSPNNTRNQNWLNAVNPFIEPPLPTATPQLSKEYIYAGSRMLAVEDANANAAPPADLAVWRPSNGFWYVMGGQGSAQTFAQFGASGDIPTEGDYDGDGKTDFAVFRPSAGTWYIQRSSDQGFPSVPLGTSGDQKAQADFDGDGKTDAAVFRSSNGTWHIQQSTAGFITFAYGVATDEPAPADFDGDGKADPTMWRASNRTFYYRRSSDGVYTGIQVSTGSGGKSVPADYDGDGTADAAFVDGGNWVIRYSSTGQTQTIAWQAGDKLVPNDYDGDGKVDIASWVASTGNWYIRQSSLGGQLRQQQWGAPDDIPVPAFYRR